MEKWWGKVYSNEMSNFPPSQESEPKPVDDNARKFIVRRLDPEIIATNGTLSYYMDVYWTDISQDSETKFVRKIFRKVKKDDQLLRIRKEKSLDGRRKSIKTPITQDEFDFVSDLFPGIPGLRKRRTELSVMQGDDEYVLKYDEFTAGSHFDFGEGTFFMMEVEPPTSLSETDSEAYLDGFDHTGFFDLIGEVSGEPDYEGHRMVETLRSLRDSAR